MSDGLSGSSTLTAKDMGRFLSRLTYGPGCWEFRGGNKGNSSHRVFSLSPSRQLVQAHRYAWNLFKGPVPAGLCVLHRCDNPPCCNPDHLWLGTKAANNADMARKGRASRGERSPQAKLTENQVKTIKTMYESGRLEKHIAEHFGVAVSSVSAIITGRNWKHV